MGTTIFSTAETSDAMEKLEQSGITKDFILYSANGSEPRVLAYSYKKAYQNAGLADKDCLLTPLGKAFFEQARDYVRDEEARTGKKHRDLPAVFSFNWD